MDLAAGALTYKQRKTGNTVVVPLHPDLATHLESIAGLDQPAKFIMPGMADIPPPPCAKRW